MNVIAYTHHVFTDGSITDGQGGRAGWAAHAIPLVGGSSLCLWGLLPAPSTSNAAELTAAVKGLQSLPDGSVVLVVTDSKYVERAILCPRAGNSHLDLRAALKQEHKRHQRVIPKWVRSHAGVGGNEFVDRVAKLALWNPELLRDPPPEFIELREVTLHV